MILTDGIHLVATRGEDIHAFAARAGLARRWYQTSRRPHYDLTTKGALARAVRLGAKKVTTKALLRALRAEEAV